MDDFTLQLSTATEYYYTPLKDLFYIESLGNDVNIYTRVGKKIFRETLTHIQELIDKEGLFKLHGCARVGRSHIINFNNVSFIDLNKFHETENNTKKKYYGKILFEHCGKKISISLNREEVKLVKALMEQLGRNPYLKLSNNTYELTVPVSELNEDAKGEQYIDLGLPSGTKWCKSDLDIPRYVEPRHNNPVKADDSIQNSSFNSNSETSLDGFNHDDTAIYKGHISWGEIKAKRSYSEKNYSFEWGLGNMNDDELYGFPNDDDYEYFLWKKCNNQLPFFFDIAARKLHTPVHIPTEDEWKELMDNCTFIWCKSCINTYGLLATSKINGRCIFLPASGYRYGKKLISEGLMLAYWTSTYDSLYQSKAFTYNNSKDNCKPKISSMDGYLGLSIRPVQGGHLAPNPTLRKTFNINGTIYRIEDPKNKYCSLYFYNGDSPIINIPRKIKYKGEIYIVTTINENAFHKAPESIFIPETIEMLPKVRPLKVLKSIKVRTNHFSFSSVDGVLFNKEKNTLLIKPDAGDNVYKVPDKVERIAENAFYYSNINTVDINLVKDIDARAFYKSKVKHIQGKYVEVLEKECFKDSTSLETIDFPNVVEVKNCVFSGCKKLQHIIFPKLEKCDWGAFNDCCAVTMTFHSQLDEIYSRLFNPCDYLEEIEFKIIPKKIHSDPFKYCKNLKTIIVGGKSYTREEFNQIFCP